MTVPLGAGERTLAWAPAVATWEVSRATRSRAATELSTSEALELIDQVRELEPGVLILGGSGRADLDRIIGRASESGLRVVLAPGLTSELTPGVVRRWAGLGVAGIVVGLDRPGAFAGARDAATDVHAAGLLLEVVSHVDCGTVADLPRTAALVGDLAPARWNVAFAVTRERAAAPPLGPNACERVFEFLYEWENLTGVAVETTSAPAFRRVRAQRDAARRGRRAGRHRPLPLNDGKGLVFVSHTGDVYPSAALPLTTANVRERRLAETYRASRLFRSRRDPLRLEGRCGACPFRALCGGSRARAYAATGNFLAADPSCAWPHPCQG